VTHAFESRSSRTLTGSPRALEHWDSPRKPCLGGAFVFLPAAEAVLRLRYPLFGRGLAPASFASEFPVYLTKRLAKRSSLFSPDARTASEVAGLAAPVARRTP
jgi:hypothetical protein